VVAISFFNGRYFKKIDQNFGEEKEIFLNPYTPPFTILKEQSTSCLSVCSEIFCLQIEHKKE